MNDLQTHDPAVFDAIQKEIERQNDGLELIASENFVSKAVMQAYLERGGFLYIDDDYGLDPYIRRELGRVLPDHELVELPFSHPIFSQQFNFPGGLPKIHEHDDEPPQGFGVFIDDRLAVFYTYETNLTDGWEPAEVHGNPEAVRQRALEMGTNILQYALTH